MNAKAFVDVREEFVHKPIFGTGIVVGQLRLYVTYCI